MKSALVALALVACSGAPEPRTTASVTGTSTSTPTPTPTSTPTPTGTSTPPLPSLDALASRAASLAPGMREVARFELAGGPSDTTRPLVTADAHDTCARVAIVAEPAVHARLVDSRSGEVLAETTAPDAALGEKGPACVRRGGAFVLHVDAPAAWTAHVVAWASP